MTQRLATAFTRARGEGRAALVGYLTAFDPDREGSLERILAACEAGLDVLELGVPFSDPTADGPAVQAAMLRARKSGARLDGVLELAAEIRRRVATPIVLFSYANPLLGRGPAEVSRRAAEAGVDGLLVVDFPPESASALREPARARGLGWIPLVALTTGPERLVRIADTAEGFVYLVSLKGVTGADQALDTAALGAQIQRLRQATVAPVAVGFGIRTPEQAATVGALADGVVVGSALIRAGEDGPAAVADLVRALRRGLESTVR